MFNILVKTSGLLGDRELHDAGAVARDLLAVDLAHARYIYIYIYIYIHTYIYIYREREIDR